MADTEVMDLAELTTLTGDETFYVVEDDDGTPVDRRITGENLGTGLVNAANVEAAGAAMETGATFTGPVAAPSLAATGPTGTTGLTPVRLVGILSDAGPPVAGDGTFAAGDAVFDTAGQEYLCTTGGTPGTWVAVGSGRCIGGPWSLTSSFTMTTAATKEDIPGLTGSFVYDGRPVIFRCYAPQVSHDNAAQRLTTLRIERSSDSLQQGLAQLSLVNATDFKHAIVETPPLTAWTDEAAFAVGTSYAIKASLNAGASTKATISAVNTGRAFLAVYTA